ncbi:MAG TPA: DUF1990 domain-containing protein [Ilumatobacteraceae bacterium]
MDQRLDGVADLALSYREVGATGTALPKGYRHLGRDVIIGRGAEAFARAGEQLMTWGAQRGAGLTIVASADRVATGVDVIVGFGPRWMGMHGPCRVVHTVEQPDRVGFAYGTLHGHPVSGEESFNVLLDDEGRVRFVLIAFSRPATPLAKIAGPFGAMAQRSIADRYADALAAVAR